MWHDVRMMNATTNTLLAALLLAGLASGAWWVAQRPMFTLQTIRIEAVGEDALRHVNASTVRNTAIPRIRGNFFTANLDTIRFAFEAVPWVRKAAVRREWPNKLVVSVEEHQALGTWGDEGKLLSVKGDVFTANLAEAEEDVALAKFDGPPGSEKDVLGRYRDFRQWLKPVDLVPEAVALSGRYAWTVRLNNGMTVELGREQSATTLQERIDRLTAIYPQLAARLRDRIEHVDLRYPNGLALKAQGLAFGPDGKKIKEKT
jgi:cell division protein FtsQ